MPDFMTRAEVAMGVTLGDFRHSWLARLAARRNPGAELRRLLLIAEDHAFTFKTCEQPYRRELDHLPYGPVLHG